MNKLSQSEIDDFLTKTSDWKIVDNKAISKEFNFINFIEALSFVNKVGEIAEKENHHPDITIFNYKNVKLVLSTHKVGGLSEKDINLALKIDGLL